MKYKLKQICNNLSQKEYKRKFMDLPDNVRVNVINKAENILKSQEVMTIKHFMDKRWFQ